MTKILIAAGGTGGHIIPALSIAKELKKAEVKLLYIGNESSMEEKLAKDNEIDFVEINVQKMYRKFTFAHFKFPFKLLISIYKSTKIINDFKPDAFLGTGGFVSGPVGIAAKLKKIPIFLQEQNSYPGLTTKFLAKFAKNIFLGNANAKKYLPIEKSIFSGNPINQTVIEEKAEIDYEKYGLRKNTTKVFLTGGSQGSVILNKVFLPIVKGLLKQNIEIIWQIGKYSFAEFYPKIENIKGVYAFDFTNEMGKIYNSTDFVIARAGALSLAEFETKKLPAILIPLPSAAENHQYFNALELKEKNVARILLQKNLTSNELSKNILEISKNVEEMKKNFNESKHLDSAKRIAEKILKNFQEKH